MARTLGAHYGAKRQGSEGPAASRSDLKKGDGPRCHSIVSMTDGLLVTMRQ